MPHPQRRHTTFAYLHSQVLGFPSKHSPLAISCVFDNHPIATWMLAFSFTLKTSEMFLPSLVAFRKICFTSMSEYSGPEEHSSTSSISNLNTITVVHVLLDLCNSRSFLSAPKASFFQCRRGALQSPQILAVCFGKIDGTGPPAVEVLAVEGTRGKEGASWQTVENIGKRPLYARTVGAFLSCKSESEKVPKGC